MNKDLLYCIFAVQSGFISSSELTEIQSSWAADPSKSILERLKSKVEAEQIELLDKLVSFAMKKHGSPEKTLSALENRDLVLKTLGGTMVHAENDSIDAVISEREVEDITAESLGRYTLKGEAGRGGIGRVLIAFDEHVGRKIAIKELLGEKDSGTGEHTPQSSPTSPVNIRFLREARVTGQLEHPGIVPVYEIGKRDDGTLYYTMRLVKGKNLKKAIEDAINLSERLKLLTHFHDLCNAVAYAHSRGVIHRDIKPENVMIGEFGETVLLDWGLAKVKGEKDDGAGKLEKGLEQLKNLAAGVTVVGHAMGTPAYMPPEQALGEIEEIDEKSDIYSLGAALYEILTGETPHTGMSAYDIIAKVVSNEIIPVQQKDAKIPKELGAIAEKALQKKKGDRYLTSRDLAEEIEQYLSGDKVGAYEYSSWELMKRVVKKNKVLFVALNFIILILVISSILVYEQKQEALFQKVVAEKERSESQKNLAAAFLEKSKNSTKIENELMYAASALSLNDEEIESKILANIESYLVPVPEKIKRFNNSLTSAAISNDMKRVAVVELGTSNIYLMSLPDLKIIKIFNDIGVVGHVLFFSHNDTKIIHGSVNNDIVIIDINSGEKRHIQINGRLIRNIVLMPDEKTLMSRVAFSDKKTNIQSWDFDTLTEKEALFDFHALSLDVSKKAKLLAIGRETENSFTKKSEYFIEIYNSNTLKKIKTIPTHSYIVSTVFTNDGKTIVSTHIEEVRVWDVETGTQKFIFETKAMNFNKIYISPDSRSMILNVNKGFELWDIERGVKIAENQHHNDVVTSAMFFQNSVLTTSFDKNIYLWNVSEFLKTYKIMDLPESVLNDAYFSLDGKRLYIAVDKKIKIIDLKRLEVAESIDLKVPIINFTVSPDEKKIVFYNRLAAVLYDREKNISTVIINVPDDGFTDIVLSPDGKTIAASTVYHKIYVYKIKEQKVVKVLDPHKYIINSIKFSPDNKILASTSLDGFVKIFETENFDEIKTIKNNGKLIENIAFSPDGKMFATSDDEGLIILWSMKDYSKKHVLKGHRKSAVMEFSNDGDYFYSSSLDNSLIFWNIEDGKKIFTIYSENDEKNELYARFSPDMKYGIIRNAGSKKFSVINGSKITNLLRYQNLTKEDGKNLVKKYEKMFDLKLEGIDVVLQNRNWVMKCSN